MKSNLLQIEFLNMLGTDLLPLFGLEAEFEIFEGEKHVHFGPYLTALGKSEDIAPWFSNKDAYYAATGAQLSVDHGLAEIATAPERIGPSAIASVVGNLVFHRNRLARVLEPRRGLRLEGQSIHINLGIEEDQAWPLCRLLMQTVAPAWTILLERPVSGGLTFRARPRRVEICMDYIADPAYLRAALVYVVGTYLALLRLWREGLLSNLPFRVHPGLAATPKFRNGLQFARSNFGGNLYGNGRNAALTAQTEGQGNRLIRAQEVLESYREFADSEIRRLAGAEDLALLDAIIGGAAPLEIEKKAPDPHYYWVSPAAVPWTPGPLADAYGWAVTRSDAADGIRTLAISWEKSCFRIDTRSACVLARIDIEDLAAFRRIAASVEFAALADRFSRSNPADRSACFEMRTSLVPLAVQIPPLRPVHRVARNH